MKPNRPFRNFSGRRGQDEASRFPGGFTLIEVMMVVAIMGLILTMGMPSFLRVIQKEGMRKAEYDMVGACQEARRAAIMNNETTDLIIRPLDGTIAVSGSTFQAQLPGDVGIDIMGVNFIQMEKQEQAAVHFYPNGTSDEFTIILHSIGGKMLEIDLDTIAGLPVLKDLR